jgi:hypothetical protein
MAHKKKATAKKRSVLRPLTDKKLKKAVVKKKAALKKPRGGY